MEDLRAFVRARLPLEGLSPADEAQIVEEIALHLADLRSTLEGGGAAPDRVADALAAELRDGTQTARTLSRLWVMRGGRVPSPSSPWRACLHDVHQGIRVLLRRPALAATAIVTMALAIGATTAVYTVVRAALLRPLPYPRAEQIVRVGEGEEGSGVSNVGYATFEDWRAQASSFSALTVMRSWQPTLVTDAPPERLAGVRISAGYFAMLGVRPALGRDFLEEEDTQAGRHAAIISDAQWRRSFKSDPEIVGNTLLLDGTPFRIIGVLPPDFEPLLERQLYGAEDIWAPLGYDATLPYGCRTCRHLRAIGRLHAGVSATTARAEVGAIQARLQRRFPADYEDADGAVVPFEDELHAPVRPLLLVLLCAAGLVLLIACANVSGLLIVQATARRREIAIRAALGASRVRLVGQLLAENGVIALTAGALGLAAAVVLRDLLVALAPAAIPRLDRAAIDWHVLAFAGFSTVVGALVAGTIPAARAAAPDVLPILRSGGRGIAGGGQRARRLLVAGQLAVAVVLLTGAGLMARTMVELARVDLGFDPADLVTFQASFVGPAYAEDSRVEALTNQMLDGIRRVPGVRAVAVTSQFPLGGNMDRWGMRIEGRSAAPGEVPDVERYGVTPDYLRVMRISLKAGRFFTEQDRRESEAVVVIGETTARRLWPDRSPLGARVKLGDPNGPVWRRVIGIVGDVRQYELDSPPPMSLYTPNSQITNSYVVFVVRTALPPDRILPSIREAVWQVARDVPVYEVMAATDIVSRVTAPRRFATALLAAFAGIAVLLAGVGLYSVIAFAVAERTREVGVRVAFGARRADIVRLIARAALRPTAAGLAGGLLASGAATQGLRAMLFGVSPTDPPTYLAVSALLCLVVAIAHTVPVRRALAVDPVVALRE